jgi:hypothetical protein
MIDSYLYYNCVRTHFYEPEFKCTSYADPLRIPNISYTDDQKPLVRFEALVIPVSRWIPKVFHASLLTYTLRSRVSVRLQDGLQDRLQDQTR